MKEKWLPWVGRGANRCLVSSVEAATHHIYTPPPFYGPLPPLLCEHIFTPPSLPPSTSILLFSMAPSPPLQACSLIISLQPCDREDQITPCCISFPAIKLSSWIDNSATSLSLNPNGKIAGVKEGPSFGMYWADKKGRQLGGHLTSDLLKPL